jgi:hypothetical protein
MWCSQHAKNTVLQIRNNSIRVVLVYLAALLLRVIVSHLVPMACAVAIDLIPRLRIRVNECCNTRSQFALAIPHRLSSILNWFKLWWEIIDINVQSTLMNSRHEYWANSHANSRLATLITSHATLVIVWPGHESWENSHPNSRLPHPCWWGLLHLNQIPQVEFQFVRFKNVY